MLRVYRLAFVAFVLLLVASPAFSADQLTVTFTVGDTSVTIVDEYDQRYIQFFFPLLNGLYAEGKVEQYVDGDYEEILIRRFFFGSFGQLWNRTAQPIDVAITVASADLPSAPTTKLVLEYGDAQAQDRAGPAAPVQIPQHGVKVWLDEQSGSPALAVEGPAIDAPSGTFTWDESETLTGATAASFVVEWTMTLGPNDQITMLGQTVRLVRTCPDPPSAAPWRRGANPVAISESKGAAVGAGLPTPCLLTASTDGTCANYRWYNICSGYIWIYGDWACGEAVGVQFGGPEQPCVAPGNIVKRAITYYRNVYKSYSTFDVHIDADDGDGCPDATLASALDIEPAERWNCSEFNVCIPSEYVIVRTRYDGGRASLATDGPYNAACDPVGVPRSFYYGINGSACVPWQGRTGRADNFLCWLIVDSGDCATSTESTTWGRLKGLYR